MTPVKINQLAKILFIGFLTGLILAVLLGQWTWLEMRVKTALLIPAGVVVAGMISFRTKDAPGLLWLVIPEAAWVTALLVLYYQELDALRVLPAIMLREGLGLAMLSLQQVNLLFVTVLIVGNLLWLIPLGGKQNA